MNRIPAGSKIGRFRVESVLGQGAMGVVYLARDPEIERAVAIKTVRPEAAVGASAAEVEGRFLKEAKLAGRLQHPNIVTVFDVGRDGEVCFIAMEYVEGSPLTRYLGRADELPLTAKVAIVRQVAEALGHAHQRGVVHRDIKPGNILITRDGRAKVTDFGIGKFTEATSAELTRTGQMIGSPAYMSPEQVRGEKLDGRSDLFSLGVVLYELLTGVRPFPGESITTLVYQILHTEPRDPLELKADLPIATREVMARLLAKDPQKRPADAGAFIRELSRIEKIQRESEVTNRAVVAPPPARSVAAVPVPSPKPASAEPVAAAVPPAPPRSPPSGMPVVLAALGVLIAASFFLLRERRSGPASMPTPAASVAVEPTVVPAMEPSPEPAAEPVPTAAPTEESVAEATAVPRATVPPRPRPSMRPKEVAALSGEKPPAPAGPIIPAPATAPVRPDRIDAVFATRRAVRFTSSPEQARLSVDGRYVGIADDWDNRGGGRELELETIGPHYVRMELPGYRTLNLQIDLTPDSGRDSISVDEEMDRYDRQPYEKLPAPYDRTTGPVEFSVEPSDAVVSEAGKTLGPVSSFGAGSPLELGGPTVHDLVLSAPGYTSKRVRVLVARNAGKDRAKVKETLKRE